MTPLLTRIFLLLLAVLMVGCDYEEVTKETGYKGKARLNPWLAAERFVARKGHAVKSSGEWLKPDWGHGVYFVPVGVLSNAGVVSSMEDWVAGGGHLVILVEYADSEWNDWNEFHSAVPELQKPLLDFLHDADLSVERDSGSKTAVTEVSFDGKSYQVEMEAGTKVTLGKGAPGSFASAEYGEGQITVVTDARIFRSRNIGEKDHAALMDALVEYTSADGIVVFLRGAGISLWKMLGRYLWPVLVGLGVSLLVWLWKSFARFGPVESAAVASPLRGYDHHLEALGDFQWRLDKASSLLAPIRSRVLENGQRAAVAAGRRDADFFQFLAEKSGLSWERVNRALTENSPADGIILTRTTADLQKLLQVLRS